MFQYHDHRGNRSTLYYSNKKVYTVANAQHRYLRKSSCMKTLPVVVMRWIGDQRAKFSWHVRSRVSLLGSSYRYLSIQSSAQQHRNWQITTTPHLNLSCNSSLSSSVFRTLLYTHPNSNSYIYILRYCTAERNDTYYIHRAEAAGPTTTLKSWLLSLIVK